MALKPKIPIDRLLLDCSASGASAANWLIAADRPDVNFMVQSLKLTVPPLADMMRNLVAAQKSQGYDHIANSMDEELASVVHRSMYCETLLGFLDDAVHRQADPEKFEKLMRQETHPAKKASLQLLMRVQVSDSQAAIIQGVEKTIRLLANNRNAFMYHFKCFTVTVSDPAP